MRRGSQLVLLAFLAVLSLAASACRQVPLLPASALVDVATLDQFRTTFNAEIHRPRLLVLLSPT